VPHYLHPKTKELPWSSVVLVGDDRFQEILSMVENAAAYKGITPVAILFSGGEGHFLSLDPQRMNRWPDLVQEALHQVTASALALVVEIVHDDFMGPGEIFVIAALKRPSQMPEVWIAEVESDSLPRSHPAFRKMDPSDLTYLKLRHDLNYLLQHQEVMDLVEGPTLH
jgi:hypothetical protein